MRRSAISHVSCKKGFELLKERHVPWAALFLFLIPNLCYNIDTCMPLRFWMK